MPWGKAWKNFAEKRNGSAFYIRNFSGFCFDVPENRKNTDIRICHQFRKGSGNWKTDIRQLPGENVFWKWLPPGF